MPVDLLLVKSVTGGPEAFFSSTVVNGFNLNRDIPQPSIPVLDAWVKSKNFSTDFFDLDRNDCNALLQKAADAEVIGFYLTYSDHFKVLDAARRVKKKYPEKFVVIGGPSILNLREDFFKISVSRLSGWLKENIGRYVDAVVFGEGEIALETILRHIRERDEIGRLVDQDHPDSQGIIYKDSNGKLHISAKPGLVPDLSLLPVPRFELNKGLIPLAFLETSRGCAFECPFCEMPGLYDSRRVKSEKQIEAEVDYIQKLGINYVIITDPAIYPDKRMEMLSQIFAGRGMIWTGYAKPGTWKSRAPLYSKGTLQMARESGCISLFFGGESASEKTQEMYGKPRIEVLKETEKICKEAGVLSCWSFMVLNPGETGEDVDQLANLLSEMEPAMCIFSPFAVTPDSDIGRHPQAYKVRITDPAFKMKTAELYARFSKNAGAENKQRLAYMLKHFPGLLHMILNFNLRKANYFRSQETGFGLSEGAFQMLRLTSMLNQKTNIKVGKSNYQLIFEMAASEKGS